MSEADAARRELACWTEPPPAPYPRYINVAQTGGEVVVTVRGPARVFGKPGETVEFKMPVKVFKGLIGEAGKKVRG